MKANLSTGLKSDALESGENSAECEKCQANEATDRLGGFSEQSPQIASREAP